MRAPLGVITGRPARDTELPIVRPVFPAVSTFADAFDHALSSGVVTNHGPNVQAFEGELSAYLGTPTLAFVSGQAALMAMLSAAGVSGREVIVPSFTFCATPHAVVWAGATPIFADIDPLTLTIDVADVERLIGPATAAILGVCVYGIACDYPRLAEVAARHGLQLLFDSAPAFGTRVDGKPIGGFGDAQIFSFHATKALATMEGGALSTRDPELLARAEAVRNFGQRGGSAWGSAGLNGKMPEIAAIIGRRQLMDFENFRARRSHVADRYFRGLSSLDGIELPLPPLRQEPIWLYFPFRVDPLLFGLTRDEVATALAADNVLCRQYFDQPCHLMPAYRDAADRRLPVTQAWADGCIALPVYNDQTDEEVDYIIDRITAIHAHADLVGRRLRRSVA